MTATATAMPMLIGTHRRDGGVAPSSGGRSDTGLPPLDHGDAGACRVG
jgi:hypothetical protein